MDIIYIIIPISLFLLFLSIYFLFWAVKNDQFSNLDSNSENILFHDKELVNKEIKKEKK